jgi:hypothetical protein
MDDEPSTEALQRLDEAENAALNSMKATGIYRKRLAVFRQHRALAIDAAYRRGIEEAAPLIAAVIAWSEAGDRLTATKVDRLPANRAFSAAHVALHKAAKEYRALAPPQEGS